MAEGPFLLAGTKRARQLYFFRLESIQSPSRYTRLHYTYTKLEEANAK